MPQLLKTWSDDELEESIRQCGPQLPVYKKGGFTVDGKRREAICRRSGIAIEVVQVNGEFRMRKILWAHHPDRCLQRIAEGWGRPVESLTLSEIATELGMKPSQVAPVLQALKGKGGNEPKKAFKSKAESIITRGLRMHVRLPPSAKALIKEAADREHRSVGDLVRRSAIAYAESVLGPGRSREIRAAHRHLDVDGPITRGLKGPDGQ